MERRGVGEGGREEGGVRSEREEGEGEGRGREEETRKERDGICKNINKNKK